MRTHSGFRCKNSDVRLTPKEFELLLYLARHASRVVTHRALLLAIWGPNSVEQPEHLRVLVAQLRKKIDSTDTPRYIITEPWVGYRFEPAGMFEFWLLGGRRSVRFPRLRYLNSAQGCAGRALRTLAGCSIPISRLNSRLFSP